MIRGFTLALVLLAGCESNVPNPNAQDKLAELLTKTQEVSIGADFQRISESLDHVCERHACSTFCQEDAATDIVPDETLVCRWDEHRGNFSVITFGTVFSVIHLADDQIVSKDIKVIYTGP